MNARTPPTSRTPSTPTPALNDNEVPPSPPSGPSRRQADVVAAADSVRVLKPRRAAPADAVRPTRAEVNLAALRHNLRVVQRQRQADQAD